MIDARVRVENYPVTSDTDQERADEYIRAKLNSAWLIAGMSTATVGTQDGGVLMMTVLYRRDINV